MLIYVHANVCITLCWVCTEEWTHELGASVLDTEALRSANFTFTVHTLRRNVLPVVCIFSPPPRPSVCTSGGLIESKTSPSCVVDVPLGVHALKGWQDI